MMNNFRLNVSLLLLAMILVLIMAFGVLDDRRDMRFQKQFDRIEAQCK